MSRNIIAAVRQLPQLKGSLFLAAVELAHLADGYSGTISASYQFLAWKIHQSRRTAIRHINRLVEMGIIKRQRFWRPNKNWLMNRYQFCIHYEHPKPRPEHLNPSVTPASILPEPHKDKEKSISMGNEKRQRETILSWLTPGSSAWKALNPETS